MTNKLPEIFYLVEYKTYEDRIEERWLFRSRKEAKNHIKKELYFNYDRKFGHWKNEDDYNMFATIITLII
tara:strand:- start:158 stop:367 length:210 start_codon:yes stop_codon:yes gene_type:complete